MDKSLEQLILEQIKPDIANLIQKHLNNQHIISQTIKNLEPTLLDELETLVNSQNFKERLLNSTTLHSALDDATSTEEFKKDLLSSSKEQVIKLIREYLSTYTLSIQTVQVVDNTGKVTHQTTDVRHKQFMELLEITKPGVFGYIIGPAGCGKTECLRQIAKALSMDFYPISPPQNIQDLVGFIDAGGVYQETDFFRAFTKGGIAVIEEIDISDPIALKVCNNAFGNRFCKFPIGRKDAHENFICFVNANTYGTGRSIEYVGNARLDAATLDRFFVIKFDYDKDLERLLYPDDEILELFWELRESAKKNNIKAIFSTRGIGTCYDLRHNTDATDKFIIEGKIFQGKTIDDLNALYSDVNCCSTNSFYATSLELLRDMRNRK